VGPDRSHHVGGHELRPARCDVQQRRPRPRHRGDGIPDPAQRPAGTSRPASTSQEQPPRSCHKVHFLRSAADVTDADSEAVVVTPRLSRLLIKYLEGRRKVYVND